jgi:hypothetical protein
MGKRIGSKTGVAAVYDWVVYRDKTVGQKDFEIRLLIKEVPVGREITMTLVQRAGYDLDKPGLTGPQTLAAEFMWHVMRIDDGTPLELLRLAKSGECDEEVGWEEFRKKAQAE